MNPRGNSKNIRTAESAASIAVTASFVVFAVLSELIVFAFDFVITTTPEKLFRVVGKRKIRYKCNGIAYQNKTDKPPVLPHLLVSGL